MYNGDNPPPYDPDIINKQLIDTFGTTTAPEDYVFGSVNVQPRANYHSEHTFNTTDLTQQQIENAAIQDTDGTIHELGINQPQNHEQGAIINESALTILKWGKYNLKSVGLHQIATATDTNHWVIPAVMSVEINLASNQVLANNGIYNVIQGQNGLEFQRVQQRSRGLPDPTGTSIGQFNVSVNLNFNIKYFNINNGTLQDIVNSLNKNNSSNNHTFDVPKNHYCLVIEKNNNENQWDFACSVNGSGATTTGVVKRYGRWGVFGAPSASLDIRIFDENSQFIAKFNEDINQDIGFLGLSLNYFNIQNF